MNIKTLSIRNSDENFQNYDNSKFGKFGLWRTLTAEVWLLSERKFNIYPRLTILFQMASISKWSDTQIFSKILKILKYFWDYLPAMVAVWTKWLVGRVVWERGQKTGGHRFDPGWAQVIFLVKKKEKKGLIELPVNTYFLEDGKVAKWSEGRLHTLRVRGSSPQTPTPYFS